MLKTKIFREMIKEKEKTYLATMIKVKNAYIFLLSEEEERFGTLAVSVPQRPGMAGPPLSSVLLGERNSLLSRMLAESLARRLGKIILLSIFTRQEASREVSHIFLSLIDKLLKKAEAGDES
ncbi:hypothetical protein DRO35_01790 [Candidatus Bathyarchaeota archaeon]|nr:MAG: hypothetical protein DRO35_01790 [Candidatus Bathyarchaeota archaeon]